MVLEVEEDSQVARVKPSIKQEGTSISTQQRYTDNENRGGRVSSRDGRDKRGGRGATYHCYKCYKLGHKSFECPDSEEARHHESHVAQGEEEDIHLQIMEDVLETGEALVMRKVMLKQVKEADEHAQQKALFKTICKVQSKCYKVIIDGGSTDNLISTEVIEKLKLQKTKHAIPYKVSWLQNGHQLLVSEQCEIDLKIGNFKDKVICDVMPMDVCHILFGRPWQYDKNTKYDVKKNVYELEKDGIKHKLMPLQDKEDSRIKDSSRTLLLG